MGNPVIQKLQNYRKTYIVNIVSVFDYCKLIIAIMNKSISECHILALYLMKQLYLCLSDENEISALSKSW